MLQRSRLMQAMGKLDPDAGSWTDGWDGSELWAGAVRADGSYRRCSLSKYLPCSPCP